MTNESWNRASVRCLGVRLAGEAIDETDERGGRTVDDTLLMLFNADDREAPFTLPEPERGASWTRVLDTAAPRTHAAGFRAGAAYPLGARSVAVLLAPR